MARSRLSCAPWVAACTLAAALIGPAARSWASTAAGTQDHRGASEPPPINWTDLGYRSKDVHGGELERDEVRMPPPLVFALVNFGILLALLGWKGGPPLRSYLDKRHREIKEALAEGARLRDQARQKLAEISERGRTLEIETDKILESVRAAAEREKRHILAQAEAQAAAMRREAEARIEAEFDRVRRELEREVIFAAAAVTERILREKLTPVDHEQLVSSFVSDVGAGPSPRPDEEPL